jgi:hypothetical protein
MEKPVWWSVDAVARRGRMWICTVEKPRSRTCVSGPVLLGGGIAGVELPAGGQVADCGCDGAGEDKAGVYYCVSADVG